MWTALTLLGLTASLTAAQSPSVTIQNGTVVGSTANQLDTFNGIPFAQPPTGTLRLKPPVPLSTTFGTLQATGVPVTCPQFLTTSSPSDPDSAAVNGPFGTQGEDCLTLNVQRPAGTSSTAKLPVLVWIYGGGFEEGATSTYNGDPIILKAVSLGKPIVYVEMNYRVGAFGFLGGKELKAEGSTNLGLRDQRLALQWVQDNIAAFGGDPTQVTIWGESAGAISVCDHTFINNGDHTYKGKPLFRAGFMESGSIIPTYDVATRKPQAIFDQVASTVGCGTALDKLSCLRNVPYPALYRAANQFPTLLSYTSLNLAYLPRPDNSSTFFANSPEDSILQGKFAKVPIIVGDQEDEGTLFALSLGNLTTTQDLITYLHGYFPDASVDRVASIVNSYPDDPAQGSPFRTGNLYNISPQYKRIAAILGDITFTLIRRAYLTIVGSQIRSWSYLATYGYNLTSLGTYHASDLAVVRSDTPSIPRDSFLTYLISFVYYSDPNRIRNSYSNVTTWPQYTPLLFPQLLNFERAQTSLLTDSFRYQQFLAIVAQTGQLRI